MCLVFGNCALILSKKISDITSEGIYVCMCVYVFVCVGVGVCLLLKLVFIILGLHKIRLKCQVPLYSCQYQGSSWHQNGLILNEKMFSL